MGKLLYALFSIMAFNVTLALFMGIVPGDTLWNFVINPQEYNDGIGDLLTDLFQVGTIGGGAVLAAGLIFNKDNLTYIGAAISLFSWGTVYFDAFNIVAGNQAILGLFESEAGARFFTAVLFSPIILTWLYIIIEWARGRD